MALRVVNTDSGLRYAGIEANKINTTGAGYFDMLSRADTDNSGTVNQTELQVAINTALAAGNETEAHTLAATFNATPDVSGHHGLKQVGELRYRGKNQFNNNALWILRAEEFMDGMATNNPAAWEDWQNRTLTAGDFISIGNYIQVAEARVITPYVDSAEAAPAGAEANAAPAADGQQVNNNAPAGNTGGDQQANNTPDGNAAGGDQANNAPAGTTTQDNNANPPNTANGPQYVFEEARFTDIDYTKINFSSAEYQWYVQRADANASLGLSLIEIFNAFLVTVLQNDAKGQNFYAALYNAHKNIDGTVGTKDGELYYAPDRGRAQNEMRWLLERHESFSGEPTNNWRNSRFTWEDLTGF